MNLLDKYRINENEIESVKIYLDDDVPEYMDGILRIGSVLVETEDEEFDIQEFVDNTEFRSEEEIEKFVDKKLGISFSQVIE